MSKLNPIDLFLNKPCEWLRNEGEFGDIVLSSRIRLARNISNYPFPHKLSPKQASLLMDLIEASIKKIPFFKNSFFLRKEDIEKIDAQFLLERHIISKDHLACQSPNAVCISENELFSVMILEEDHLRLQILEPGFSLIEAWKIMDAVDSSLEEVLQYAFHSQWGYLAACPTNVGTGMRASCMMHLPALVMTKQMNRVIQAVSKLNLTARGLYGEGTEASGNLFQFSNQATLGYSEEDIIDSLSRVIKQIVMHEREARKTLIKKRRVKLEDQIWRAFGVLKTARLISSQETMTLLSMIRLGIDLGLIKGLDIPAFNDCFLKIQPAHLQKISGKILTTSERDSQRASYLRKHLSSISFE